MEMCSWDTGGIIKRFTLAGKQKVVELGEMKDNIDDKLWKDETEKRRGIKAINLPNESFN